MSRKLVLAAVALALVIVLAGVRYVRHVQQRAVPPAAKADCATTAPPPPAATPPPKLPGFSIEPACGADTSKPAASKKKQ